MRDFAKLHDSRARYGTLRLAARIHALLRRLLRLFSIIDAHCLSSPCSSRYISRYAAMAYTATHARCCFCRRTHKEFIGEFRRATCMRAALEYQLPAPPRKSSGDFSPSRCRCRFSAPFHSRLFIFFLASRSMRRLLHRPSTPRCYILLTGFLLDTHYVLFSVTIISSPHRDDISTLLKRHNALAPSAPASQGTSVHKR